MFTWTVTLHTLRFDALWVTDFNRAFTLAIALLTFTIPDVSLTLAIGAFAVFLSFPIAVPVSVTTIIGVVVGPGTCGGDYARYGCRGCRWTGWTDGRVRWRICGDALTGSMKFGTQTRKFFFILLSYFPMLGFKLVKRLADDV